MTLLLLLSAITAADLDRDGLNDKLEDKLLKQFRPSFFIDSLDCDARPAEFVRGAKTPTPGERNATIYGQVSRQGNRVEIHYYHLWTNDCGRGSHPLDAEHVAVLVEQQSSGWRALYWIGNGHDGTLCDRRHGATAASVGAIDKGASVWISHGKHASFLSQAKCGGGCGADRCDRPVTLARGKLINLGEASAPMPGYEWIHAKRGTFHLASKMTSEFTPSDLAALDRAKGVASLSPIPAPAQAFLLGGNTAGSAVVTGQRHTESALEAASEHVDRAFTTSYDRVKESFRKTKLWLKRR